MLVQIGNNWMKKIREQLKLDEAAGRNQFSSHVQGRRIMVVATQILRIFYPWEFYHPNFGYTAISRKVVGKKH